jgi:SAM-dependent methyltransferase
MMRPKAVFDHAAAAYDHHFTHAHTGKLQRNRVWNYLDKSLPNNKSLRILELNCGTGEDALYLAKKGHQVLATDLSREMIDVATAKTASSTFKENIDYQVLSIEETLSLAPKKFDIVFSNFGGFNCVPPEALANFLDQLPSLLHNNGRFIAVIMPRFCLQESLYFLLKGQLKTAFRRWSKKAIPANVDGHIQSTWYYAPNAISKALNGSFHTQHLQPIGFFLPASYLEKSVHSKKVLLRMLYTLERWTQDVKLLSAAADHFLIDLKKRK